ncbi:hypothetical protein PR048_022506 [Dryococelus australis]|uniref:Receptor ligand binding region domain-containing protein n=1 Tax=Dryococelus australis TaxID=614101 RepID=A0ABQ9H178_9NEOP|nr:hypothetical protein PR048_022506 [Dryococelus australis]
MNLSLTDLNQHNCRSYMVAERLARQPPTKANRVQSPAGSPDFRMWESTMPWVGGFSGRSPVSPAPIHFDAAPFASHSSSSALKTSLLRAAQISSLTNTRVDSRTVKKQVNTLHRKQGFLMPLFLRRSGLNSLCVTSGKHGRHLAARFLVSEERKFPRIDLLTLQTAETRIFVSFASGSYTSRRPISLPHAYLFCILSAVVQWLEHSTPAKANLVPSQVGPVPDGNRAGRLDYDPSPFPPRFTLTGSQDLVVKNCAQISTPLFNDWLVFNSWVSQLPARESQTSGTGVQRPSADWSSRNESKSVPCSKGPGATVAERLARSPPAKANRVHSPAVSADFHKWDSCRMMPLVAGFSRGSLLRASQISSLSHSLQGFNRKEQRKCYSEVKTGEITCHDGKGIQQSAFPSRNTSRVLGVAEGRGYVLNEARGDALVECVRQSGSSPPPTLQQGTPRGFSLDRRMKKSDEEHGNDNFTYGWIRGNFVDSAGYMLDSTNSLFAVHWLMRQVSMEQCRNARAEGEGYPRENPPTSGFVRHHCHMRKFGADPAGNLTRFCFICKERSTETRGHWYEVKTGYTLRQQPMKKKMWLETTQEMIAERLYCSPPTKASPVRSLTDSFLHFRMWESCQTNPLAGGFPRGSPVSLALVFRCCSSLISFLPHQLSRPRCQEPPKSLNSNRKLVKRGRYGAAPECKGGGNGRSPRKPADQWHRLARFPLVKIRRMSETLTQWCSECCEVFVCCLPAVCNQFSRGVFAMLGAVSPDSFDTLHSYSNTFQMPFVTPWFPEKSLPLPEDMCALRVRWSCASKAQKRGSNTGDTIMHAECFILSYAQGVQCFRHDVLTPSSGFLDYAVSMRPDYHQAIIDVVRYYGWRTIIYLYDSHDGCSILSRLLQFNKQYISYIYIYSQLFVVRLLGSHLGEPGSIPPPPAGSLPDFRIWELYRTMTLVGEFSRGSSFRRCSVLTLLHPHWLSRPRAQINFRDWKILNVTHLRCLPANHGHSVSGLPDSDWPSQATRDLELDFANKQADLEGGESFSDGRKDKRKTPPPRGGGVQEEKTQAKQKKTRLEASDTRGCPTGPQKEGHQNFVELITERVLSPVKPM